MTSGLTLAAAAVLGLLATAAPAGPPDWESFDDPKAIVLTDTVADSVRNLPVNEKAAAVKRLQGSLKSNEVEVRRRAALTLAALGDKTGVPTMIGDLSTATGRDRDNVAVALRILKDERAVPALRQALKDKSPYVRGIAAAALGELKAAKAYDDLVALSQDKEGLDGGKKDSTLNCLRMCPAFSAMYALGARGDEKAVPILIDRLADADFRGPARQALEALTKQKLGDDPERWKAWWKEKNR